MSTLNTIYRALMDADTREDRENLLIALAESVQREWDSTDLGLSDETHRLHEDLAEATTAYRQAAFRLGRLVVSALNHAESEDLDFDEEEDIFDYYVEMADKTSAPN